MSETGSLETAPSSGESANFRFLRGATAPRLEAIATSQGDFLERHVAFVIISIWCYARSDLGFHGWKLNMVSTGPVTVQ